MDRHSPAKVRMGQKALTGWMDVRGYYIVQRPVIAGF